MLDEGLTLGAPPAFHDLFVDLVPLDDPPGEGSRPSPMLSQANGAIQCYPRHQAAVGEVLAASSGLPDAFLRLIPVLAEPVDYVRQSGPEFVPHLQAVDVGEMDGIHRLAVDVELQLIGRAVADSYRARAAIAL